MIRVTLDVVGRDYVSLAELRIINDGTGTAETADYEVTLAATGGTRHYRAKVKQYPRARGAIHLVELALKAMLAKYPQLGIEPR